MRLLNCGSSQRISLDCQSVEVVVHRRQCSADLTSLINSSMISCFLSTDRLLDIEYTRRYFMDWTLVISETSIDHQLLSDFGTISRTLRISPPSRGIDHIQYVYVGNAQLPNLHFSKVKTQIPDILSECKLVSRRSANVNHQLLSDAQVTPSTCRFNFLYPSSTSCRTFTR